MTGMNLEQALAIIVGEAPGSEADQVAFTAAAGLARIWRNHLAGKPPSPAAEICDSLFELLDDLGLEVDLSPGAPLAVERTRIVSMPELRHLRRAQRALDDARRALLEAGVAAHLEEAEAAIPATVAVEVPCILCHRPSLVGVGVGLDPEPSRVLCGDCDSFVTSEVEAQRRREGQR